MQRGADDRASSFGEEIVTHLDALYNFARYLTGEATSAEDLVQDTFARALDAEASFVRGSNLKAWAFRIMRNAFIDKGRREQRNPVAVGRKEGVSGDETLLGPAPSELERTRLRAVATPDVNAALARLSEDARSVILLDLEGFTETEIASAFGCAVGTVKSRLARARAALRQALEEYAR